ncbi:unnamed protein product [Heligmosomoides polygyrus]|uniref:Serpentine receptor class gamma n=1 Tax=Heligmosomoides polygyrus TaxID=6339 RepID=A0A183FJ36_HELPZ|nr:unnamed protein product [Heligmosomoides polygyrus]
METIAIGGPTGRDDPLPLELPSTLWVCEGKPDGNQPRGKGTLRSNQPTYQLFLLQTIWRDDELRRMASYRLMFALGIFDVLQCIPHFITGVFTVCQSIFHPALAKAISILASPCYVAYILITLILAFNRFIQAIAPYYNKILFTAPIAYVSSLNFFKISFYYFIYINFLKSNDYFSYSWVYDFNLLLSGTVQKTAMTIELTCIFIVVLLYSFIIISIYVTKKRYFSTANNQSEIKILIQAIVIGAYCTVLNLLWHQSQILPTDLWWQMGLNFMWVLSSGVYPTIYFIVNRLVILFNPLKRLYANWRFSRHIEHPSINKLGGSEIKANAFQIKAGCLHIQLETSRWLKYIFLQGKF